VIWFISACAAVKSPLATCSKMTGCRWSATVVVVEDAKMPMASVNAITNRRQMGWGIAGCLGNAFITSWSAPVLAEHTLFENRAGDGCVWVENARFFYSAVAPL
jgi:hypothetical protein